MVHYEGVSNGRDLGSGVKKYQVSNHERFYEKWKGVLLSENYPGKEALQAARERKQSKKTVLFVSEKIPEYDKDAGSRTLFFYMGLFIEKGYIVKFLSNDKLQTEPYTTQLQRAGVEVVSGSFMLDRKKEWIKRNARYIDFAFLNYPNCSYQYINILKENGIPIRYYGVDIHYLRRQREYELFGNEKLKQMSDELFQKEKYLIENSEVVYYPSLVEVGIVKKDFGKKAVKQLLINVYKEKDIVNTYDAMQRKGMLFIGGYQHTPNVDAVLWFVKEVFPKIRSRMEMEWLIAGSNMPWEISSIDEKGVRVLGRVSDEELKRLYNQIRMVVIPLRYGAGIKGKVIEAMFHGVPVVSTSIGMEGIPRIKSHATVADTAEEMAGVITGLYEDRDSLNRISQEETEIIKNHYSETVAWNNIAEDF